MANHAIFSPSDRRIWKKSKWTREVAQNCWCSFELAFGSPSTNCYWQCWLMKKGHKINEHTCVLNITHDVMPWIKGIRSPWDGDLIHFHTSNKLISHLRRLHASNQLTFFPWEDFPTDFSRYQTTRIWVKWKLVEKRFFCRFYPNTLGKLARSKVEQFVILHEVSAFIWCENKGYSASLKQCLLSKTHLHIRMNVPTTR